jgi:hypothetical protein
MASKRQRLDAKAKEKKQKLIAAVGAVLLLGLLVFQVPRTLKMLHPSQSGSSSSAAATTTASTTPAPTPPGGSVTPAPASPGSLINSDPPPPAQNGELVSFSHFTAKDPFDQQVSVDAGGSGSGSTTPTPPDAGTTAPTPTTPTATTPTTTTPTETTPTSTTPTPPAASLSQASISINGAPEDVKLGATFPADQPYFKLVSLAPDHAKIGIAGGSLASRDPTVTLVKGKKLTLQNTADGTRYELILVATS